LTEKQTDVIFMSVIQLS